MGQTYDTPAKATIRNTPDVPAATKRPRTRTLPAGTPFDNRRYPRQQREVTSETGPLLHRAAGAASAEPGVGDDQHNDRHQERGGE
ncbi:MAG: hypothetical protein O7B77_06870, partial [Actinobacteria bacterium]|nr:hypothetical protein [Actinomycetota bacterium]